MGDYCRDLVSKFEKRMGVVIKDAETPWLDGATEKRWAHERDEEG